MKTTFGELASAVGKVTPIAASLGVTTDELFSSLASTTAQGLGTAESVTALKAAMSNIIKPSKEASEAAQALGIDFSISALKSKGWIGFLKDIRENLKEAAPAYDDALMRQEKYTKLLAEGEKAGGKNNSQLKEYKQKLKEANQEVELLTQAQDSTIGGFATMFGSVEGLNSILMLTSENGMEKYNESMGQMKTNTGALDDAYNKMAETTESKFSKAMNKAKNSLMELGVKALPVVEKGIDLISKLADKFNNLSPAMQDNIVKVGLASAALGPFTSGIGGAIKGVTGLLKTGKKVGTFFGAFNEGVKATKILKEVGTATELATGAAGGGGVLGLAGSLGTAIGPFLPWIAGAAAVAGAGYLIHKQLSKETIPTVDLFADKTIAAVDKVNGGVRNFTTTISESTKEAVGAYMELDKGATDALNNLYFNSTAITEDNKNVLIGKYTEMGTMINQGLQEKRDEDINSLSEFFGTTNTLTDAEEALILQKTNEHYEERKGVTDIYQRQINDIVSNASENRRGITEEEYRTIADIQQRQKEQAIKVLSENEIEAGVILERMKEYDGRITAEQASKHIGTLNESRDKAVQIANDEYEKRVAAILRTKSESSSMTQEQADKLIAEAARQRDGIIDNAEDTRLGAIDKMRSMNGDLDSSVETTTGKILSTWDKISRWWNGWKPEKKNFSYDVSGGGGGNNRATVAMNASGTSNFSGGLTTMHEKGYELYNTYDMPQRSRIWNHQASEAMVRETAKEVAQSVLQGMDMPGGGDIIIPISIAGEEIDRIVVPRVSSRLALNTIGRR